MESDDLIIARVFGVNPRYAKTKDGHTKVKSVYNAPDLLFDSVGDFLQSIITPTWIHGLYSNWIKEIGSILSQFFEENVFKDIYEMLDKQYPNKTVEQVKFMQYLENCYSYSRYNTFKRDGVDQLLIHRIHVHDDLFVNRDVASMVFEFFRLAMKAAFNLKLKAALWTLTESKYIQSEYAKGIDWIDLHFAQNMSVQVHERIESVVKYAKEFLVEQNKNIDHVIVNHQSGLLEDILYHFTMWKLHLDAVNYIYEWKFLENTPGDISIVLFEQNTQSIDKAVNKMGYTMSGRIKRYLVSWYLSHEQLKFDIKALTYVAGS